MKNDRFDDALECALALLSDDEDEGEGSHFAAPPAEGFAQAPAEGLFGLRSPVNDADAVILKFPKRST